MLPLGLIDRIPDYQLPVSRIGGVLPFVRRSNLLGKSSSFGELRQPLRYGFATLARFGQGFDILGDRRIEVAFAFINGAQSVSVDR